MKKETAGYYINAVKTVAIFSGYHLPHLGGIERYTDNLSQELIKKGYKVIIVSSDYQFDKKYIVDENDILYLKLPVRKLFVSRYPIPKKNKEFKKVMNKLDEYKIDAIITNTRFHLTTLVGAKYGKKNQIPVFLVEHGSEHLTVDNKVLDFFGAIYEHLLTSRVKKYVNYYYGVSKEACNWQKHFGINSNGVWYNSIKDFSENIEIKKSKKIKILYAGRILKQKGLIELVKTFELLSKKYDNIELNVAGEGNLLNELKENYAYPNINYLGKLNFKELCKYYNESNIFVYAPLWPEGLPTSILEAGLMKCAVIISPYGGSKEIVTDNVDGLIIKNSNELKNALIRLIEEKNLREKLGERLNKRIKEQFVWTNTSNKIINDLKEGIKKYKEIK